MTRIAVIDIGKSNAKLALVDLDSLSEIAVETRPNTVLPGPPWPHYDLEGHWQFILDGLARLHAAHGVDGIAVTAHGASIVLLDRHGDLAAPMLDYEHDGPDSVAAEYDAIRPDFAQTGSPRLKNGLNVGAQLFWQFRALPGLREKVATVIPYSQYWAFRLTGVAAGEASSYGAHTDLWNPASREFSALPARLGIAGKMAAPRPPGDILGPILPQIVRATGLPPDTPVVSGMHDSNASLYPHLLTRRAPFSVVSTGTWVICMAVGGANRQLDPERDTLMNVNALGDPVPSARFMGGREFETVMAAGAPDPSPAEIADVLAQGAMLLPAIDPANGPFQGMAADWRQEPAHATGARTAAMSFYLALVTAECLGLIGQRGTVVVEGAFARNRAFLGMLAAATGARVEASGSATGTSAGAALLFRPGPVTLPPGRIAAPLPGGAAYADAWRGALKSHR